MFRAPRYLLNLRTGSDSINLTIINAKMYILVNVKFTIINVDSDNSKIHTTEISMKF